MNYDVKFTRPAENDLTESIRYISQKLSNPSAARRFLDQIDNETKTLETMPYRYPVAPQTVNFMTPWEIRMFPVRNYLVFYAVDEKAKTVWILRVLYGPRNWQEMIDAESNL